MQIALVRALWAAAAVVVVVGVCAVSLDVIMALLRPPQPLPLGSLQWLGEVGVTVDGVDRIGQIGNGASAVRARGEYYVVHARIVAPLGLRPTWHDSDVEVQTFAINGATMPPRTFAVDERAQTILDRQTGRPGSVHLVRGAQEHEDLIFDLPRNVEQPGLVFLPANDPWALLGVVVGEFWQPHRFNLRYD